MVVMLVDLLAGYWVGLKDIHLDKKTGERSAVVKVEWMVDLLDVEMAVDWVATWV